METLFTPLNCSELEFFPLCLPSFCFTSSSLIPVALEQPGPAGAGRICPVLGCRSGVVGDTHGCRLSAVTEPRGAGQCLQKHPARDRPSQRSTGTVVFPASKETKSQTFSTLISLSCVLLLIPPRGLWGSDRRALQRIKGLLCSAVRGCRTRAGWCNQILPVPRVLPWLLHQPLWLPVQAGNRSHSHKLDLPQPPRLQPSIPLALSDTRGGDPKAKPVGTQRLCCPGLVPHSSGAVGPLSGCCGSGKGCGGVQHHSEPCTEWLLKPKGWLTAGSHMDGNGWE